MAARFSSDFKQSDFLRNMQAVLKSVEVAIHGAVTDAGKEAVIQGDIHVSSKGFPRGFRSVVEPKQPSIQATATITHRRGYLGVFEHGGPIQGQPLLWLPIEANLPPSNRRWTPRRFVGRFGKLSSIRGSTKPILVGTVGGQSVPVFHGVRTVNIRKRLDFAGVVDKIVAGLVDLYDKHLRL